MMRRFAVVGDKLSNNGEICDYKGPFFTLSGHQAALINGAAYCPVCKTTGYIAKEGGPRRMTLGASEIALENDVVICDCPDHPRIFARLAGEAWYEDLVESLGAIRHCATGSDNIAAAPLASVFDEAYVLRSKMNGKPLSNVAYRLIGESGTLIEGVTDAAGRTQRIRTNAAERVTVAVEDVK
ncbi:MULTISPECIES: PAAR domain-containing protein [Caballeronia]|uniref:PAAR domain-containing protein n=1 Tax=Caballeronia TaxID=1827195 RepID=UPI00158C37C1|nr:MULTISPECIES: PAAR domain-containing protein [Caballeronia]MCG7404619.1 PAAR domain-containing protein [Caballeronia zhejiangensis]MCI1044045.1 PAAR domain-containing protein [Caballeronia zhejiangensis]